MASAPKFERQYNWSQQKDCFPVRTENIFPTQFQTSLGTDQQLEQPLLNWTGCFVHNWPVFDCELLEWIRLDVLAVG